MGVKIKYLDGKRFKRSILASVQMVYEAENFLNEINVFPVADGDTGTNMALTLSSIVDGTLECPDDSFEEVSTAIADSALMGARGNSGVILAQFFQGLAEATRGKVRLTTHSFANAVSEAVERTKSAISAPREGTIISVMKDWSNHLRESAAQTPDFVELLRESLVKAKDSLADTPNKLKVLKKAGVVDAGAAGFVKMLEGVVDFMAYGKITANKIRLHVQEKFESEHLRKAGGKMKYRFCTECLIEGDNLDMDELKGKLQALGDSLIVIGGTRKARIHIHSNQPQSVFEIAAQYGRIAKSKAEDMQHQHHEAVQETPADTIALVTDSTCDLPQEVLDKYHVHVIPVTVQVGDKSYKDRIEITPAEFCQMMETTNHKLLTSQPAPALFKETYNQLSSTHSEILSIHISGKLSGSVEGARMGRKACSEQKKITVIDSRSSSAGLGLLVAEAGRLIEAKEQLSVIMERIEELMRQLKIFVNIPTLKYLVRSGRLSRPKGLLATALNLKPIITINEEGSLVETCKVIGKKKGFKKTVDLAMQYAQNLKWPKFNIAHARAEDLACWYKEQIQKRFPGASVMIAEASPALTLHIGIGGTAIAVVGER